MKYLRIAICTPPVVAGSTSTVKQYLEKRGHHPDLVFRAPVPNPGYSAALFRGASEADKEAIDLALEALSDLEAQGVKAINSVEAVRITRNKLLSARYFQEAKIPHPPTFLSWEEEADNGPYIVKPVFGSQGEGIKVSESFTQAKNWEENLGKRCLIQSYLEGKTYRVVASREQALWAYEKVAGKGQLFANISQGATRRFIDLDNSPLANLAIEMVRALKGDLMGVDILEHENKFYALEGNTGFRLYKEDTSLNLLLAKEIENLANLKA